MLEAVSLAVGYGKRVVARNVSFCLRPGAFLALIGPNGAGKSALLRSLAGISPPLAGEILIDAKNARALPPKARARRVAFMPQNSPRPNGVNAGEFVRLGRYPWLAWHGFYGANDRDIARKAMEFTDSLAFQDRPATELSGGEWQRIRLARTLAQVDGEPNPIVLLDEFSAGLDISRALETYKKLDDLRNRGYAVLAAAHDCNHAALFASEILAVKNGAVAFYGPVAETFTKENLSALYDLPVGVAPHPDLGLPQAYVRFPGNSRRPHNRRF